MAATIKKANAVKPVPVIGRGHIEVTAMENAVKKNPHHPVKKHPGTTLRNPQGGRITPVHGGKKKVAVAAPGFTTSDLVMLGLVAIAAVYLWKKL